MGHQGGLIILHCSALLQQANQIPSRRSRWSISSSPFSRWDYLLRFKTSRVDVYCGSGLSAIRLQDADAELPAVSSYLRPPPQKNVPAGGDVPGVGATNDQTMRRIWPLKPLRQTWGGAILIHLFLRSILLSMYFDCLISNSYSVLKIARDFCFFLLRMQFLLTRRLFLTSQHNFLSWTGLSWDYGGGLCSV